MFEHSNVVNANVVGQITAFGSVQEIGSASVDLQPVSISFMIGNQLYLWLMCIYCATKSLTLFLRRTLSDPSIRNFTKYTFVYRFPNTFVDPSTLPVRLTFDVIN